MPLYDFLDMENNEVFEALFKFAEKDAFLEENPHIKQIMLKPPMIVSGVGGVKTDDGFQDLLKKMASEHPDSNLGRSISGSHKTVKQVVAPRNCWYGQNLYRYVLGPSRSAQ